MVVFASLGVFAILRRHFGRSGRRRTVFGIASAVDQAVYCCLCLAEDLEGRLARGEEIDVERHALLCSTLTRLA